jgi:hypothetical protein
MAFSISCRGHDGSLSWSAVNWQHYPVWYHYHCLPPSRKRLEADLFAVILLPEILIDVMMVLILLDKVFVAALFLLVSILAWPWWWWRNASFGLAVSKYHTDESKVTNLQQPQDELMSYFKGRYEPCKERNTEQVRVNSINAVYRLPLYPSISPRSSSMTTQNG